MPNSAAALRFRRPPPGGVHVGSASLRETDTGENGEDTVLQRSPGAGAASSFDGAHALDALVRAAYYNHVSSQILVSSLPPWVRPRSRRWAGARRGC